MPTKSSRRTKALTEQPENVNEEVTEPESLVEKKKTKKKSKKQAVTTSDCEADVANTIVNDVVEEEATLEPELLVESSKKKKKKSRKRAAATSDTEPDLADSTMNDTGHLEAMDGVLVDDINEPTIGEKLSLLNVDVIENKIDEKQESLAPRKPPSADSVSVLLKQALHADDCTLLLDCLYTRDEKVIANSTSALNPSDVSKLLHALISVIQSRGAVLVCALPWLRFLLVQHASGIVSQESSLLELNSLYQLIDSRVATFGSALQLSSSLDFLYSGVLDEGQDENDAIIPVIFEDNDESDEESEDGMDTDEDDEIALGSDGDVIDIEGIESMSD